jgi:hypothetical protein
MQLQHDNHRHNPTEQNEYFNSTQFCDHVERYRARRDLEFYFDAARDSGGPVLEMGCGKGQVLIPVARPSTTAYPYPTASRALPVSIHSAAIRRRFVPLFPPSPGYR